MKKVKIKEIVSYNGHSVRNNGAITLNFKAMYSELTKTIELLQLLNNDVTLSTKNERIGVFRVKDVVIGGDGESKLKFDSMVDYVETDIVNKLVSVDGEFCMYMESVVDMEDGKEEIEEEETDEQEEGEADEEEDWDDEDWDE